MAKGVLGRGISIRMAITLVAVALVLASGGLVLAFVYKTSSAITKELIRERAEIVNRSIVERVRSHLTPVEAQAGFAAQIIRQRDVEDAGGAAIGSMLFGTLAASPQVSSIALVDSGHVLIRAFRNRPDTPVVISDWSDDESFVDMMVQAWLADAPYWGPLFYAESSDATFLNFLTPVKDKTGKPFVIVSSVSLSALSRFLRSLQDEISGTPFILAGDEAVLAHALLAEGYDGLSDRQPLPGLAGFPDPILAQIWSPDRLSKVESDLANDLEARVLPVGDEIYVFLFRRQQGFGAPPWIIGSYFTLDSVADALGRTQTMVALGAAVIAVALLLAFLVSRLISRPVRALAATADCINRWELESCAAPRRSLFKEINEANTALDAAVKGLQSLKVYLPRGLARRLVRPDGGKELQTEERMITVLFTDIVGFTARAEAMAPKAVLQLLNEHFSLVATCIRHQQGIVDKFIGDSAMAFWGGMGNDEDHAVNACRAAVDIMDALRLDNEKRRTAGLEPIALCVGVHSGLAMVGNIGFEGRVNFTVIGDTVNTAQRLEALGREVREGGEDAVCLISGQTAEHLDPEEFSFSAVGGKVLHGRQEQTEVYRLEARNGPGLRRPAPVSRDESLLAPD